MSYQDLHVQDVRRNSVYLQQALQWLLGSIRWEVTFRKSCSWTPRWLVATALLWVWSAEQNLTERFHCAQRLVCHLQADHAKQQTSWQAFMKVLRRWTPSLISALQKSLRKRMQTEFGAHFKMCGYAVFGVDGSRVDVPRTSSNQQAYSPGQGSAKSKTQSRRKKKGDRAADKKATVPQIWLTVMFHVGLDLCWDWRTGRSNSSERFHALEMIDDLPACALLTGDAGFVGYEFSRRVRARQCELVVRAGSNVRLLKKLGYVRESNSLVYLWPDKAAAQNMEPLVFRLVTFQGPRHPIFLLTSVLDKKTLSDQHVIEIYKARWGVEVYYRHFKQTFGRRKLRSQNSQNAKVEIDWSLAGLWALGLFATAELADRNISSDRLSMAGVLKAFRQMARDYYHPADQTKTLRILIRTSLLDEYTRTSKASRDYPRKKKRSPAGKPKITTATKPQVAHAKSIKRKMG